MDEQNRTGLSINEIINLLNKDYNLQTLENLTKMYLSSNTELCISKFINFQTQIFTIFNEYAPALLDLLKIDNIPSYNGKDKQVYRRLFELNRIAKYNLRGVEEKMLNPERLKATHFNIEKGKKEFRMLLSKYDGHYLSTTLLFNDGLYLAASILHNLIVKFNSGNNSINYNAYKDVKNKYSEIERLLESFFEEQQRDDVIESSMDESIS